MTDQQQAASAAEDAPETLLEEPSSAEEAP
jgi:hypothetical protein